MNKQASTEKGEDVQPTPMEILLGRLRIINEDYQELYQRTCTITSKLAQQIPVPSINENVSPIKGAKVADVFTVYEGDSLLWKLHIQLSDLEAKISNTRDVVNFLDSQI